MADCAAQDHPCSSALQWEVLHRITVVSSSRYQTPCCVAIAAMALERNIQVLKHEVGIENEKPLPKAM